MVVSDQRGHLVKGPLLCSAELTVASCSAQLHENFWGEAKNSKFDDTRSVSSQPGWFGMMSLLL